MITSDPGVPGSRGLTCSGLLALSRMISVLVSARRPVRKLVLDFMPGPEREGSLPYAAHALYGIDLYGAIAGRGSRKGIQLGFAALEIRDIT
jgi:hypothetical protein